MVYDVVGAGDTVFERDGEGTDTALVSIASYTLPDNVENLEFTMLSGRPAEPATP